MPEELNIDTKLHDQIQLSPIPQDLKLWENSIIYSIIIGSMITLYYTLTTFSFTQRMANQTIADVAVLLIGLSLILSSLCYFWNFADTFIIYRKHLGLVGAGYMILHILFSIFGSPYAPFPAYYFVPERIHSFVAALTATVIILFLVIISNRLAIHEIGPKRWRKFMRIGFVGYAFVLFHFGVKGAPLWIPWLTGKSSILFPPFSLIAFVFGATVIILRLALWVSLIKKGHVLA